MCYRNDRTLLKKMLNSIIIKLIALGIISNTNIFII